MNQLHKLQKIQKKIYDKARYSTKKNKYILKEKHLHKLHNQVLDYVENNFYWNTNEELNYLSEIITKGLINEVLEVLDD